MYGFLIGRLIYYCNCFKLSVLAARQRPTSRTYCRCLYGVHYFIFIFISTPLLQVVIGGDGSLTGANIFREEWPGLLSELSEQGTARHDDIVENQ